MASHLLIADSGYQYHQLVIDEGDHQQQRESFFNTEVDYETSCTQFRFSRPGQHLTEDYQIHIRGFFMNEPCIYNHTIFGYATRLFEVMMHHDDPSDSGGRTATKTVKPVARKQQLQVTPVIKHNRRLSITPGNLLPAVPNSASSTHSVGSARRKGLGLGSAAMPRISTARKKIMNELDLPELEFESQNEKRLTYQLVFQTLKYQKFLHDMLKNSKFFEQCPEYYDDLCAVMVILCDFKLRKFQRRLLTTNEVIVPKMSNIEEALYQSKVRLNAALARSRIESQVLSIDFLLPDSVRKNERIGSKMHTTCWVNCLKASVFYVKHYLLEDGFREALSEDQLIGKTYLPDDQFEDVLSFPHELMSFVEYYPLVVNGVLVIQDKSSAVGAHSIKKLMSDNDDVLHINVGSCLTSVHIASLTHGSPSTIIYGVGIISARQHAAGIKTLERLGALSRVKLLTNDFLTMKFNDENLRNIKLVLLTTLCSKSGVANPVNFVVSENEDVALLKDLSLGYTDINKLGILISRHQATLNHALRFPRVQGVVYTTCSLIEAENETVVTNAIEYVSKIQQTKVPFRLSPPVLPLSAEAIDNENPLVGKYLKYMPTSTMSGCFVACITRESEDPKEAAKGILARAAARGMGIMNGVANVRDLVKEIRPIKKKKSKKDKDTKVKTTKMSKGKKKLQGDSSFGTEVSDIGVSASNDTAAAAVAAADPLPSTDEKSITNPPDVEQEIPDQQVQEMNGNAEQPV